MLNNLPQHGFYLTNGVLSTRNGLCVRTIILCSCQIVELRPFKTEELTKGEGVPRRAPLSVQNQSWEGNVP